MAPGRPGGTRGTRGNGTSPGATAGRQGAKNSLLMNVSVNTKMLGLLQDSLPGFSQQDSQIQYMAYIINLAVQ